MKILLSTLILFCSTFVIAQEKYRIQYDYKTDHFEYFKLNNSNKIVDTLNSPKFKRNSLIEIKLLNVNPFAVSIQTDVKEEEVHASGANGFNFSNLLGGISAISENELKLNVTNLPNKETSRGVETKFSELHF